MGSPSPSDLRPGQEVAPGTTGAPPSFSDFRQTFPGDPSTVDDANHRVASAQRWSNQWQEKFQSKSAKLSRSGQQVRELNDFIYTGDATQFAPGSGDQTSKSTVVPGMDEWVAQYSITQEDLDSGKLTKNQELTDIHSQIQEFTSWIDDINTGLKENVYREAGSPAATGRSFAEAEGSKQKEVRRQFLDFMDRAEAVYGLRREEFEYSFDRAKANAWMFEEAGPGGSAPLGSMRYYPAATSEPRYSQVVAPTVPREIPSDYRLNNSVGLPGAGGFTPRDYEDVPRYAEGTPPQYANGSPPPQLGVAGRAQAKLQGAPDEMRARSRPTPMPVQQPGVEWMIGTPLILRNRDYIPLSPPMPYNGPNLLRRGENKPHKQVAEREQAEQTAQAEQTGAA